MNVKFLILFIAGLLWKEGSALSWQHVLMSGGFAYNLALQAAMEERVFSNIRRNHMLDVFRMRNPRIMKRDEDDKKLGAVILPQRYERIQTFSQNVIRYHCASVI